MVWTSLSTVRINITDASKAVCVNKTDVVEGIVGSEKMFDTKDLSPK